MKELTSLERIIKVFKREKPDRVPLAEILIDPKVIDSIHPGMSYYDFLEKEGYDAVGPNTTMDALGRVKWIDESKRVFIDRWGIKRQFTEDLIPVPIEGAIQSKQDLLNYKAPDPTKEPLLQRIPEIVERFKDKKAIFILGRDAWTGSYMLRGMINILMDLVSEPQLAKDIIKLNVEYYKEVHRLAIELGVDYIHLCDDYAYKTGTLMSPKQWKEFIYPGFYEIVQDIKKHGAYVIKHTDGNIWEIIDWIVDAGIDCIGPLEPEAGMNLASVKEKYGDRVAVYGNISCHLLGYGSPEEVEREVKDIILNVSPCGGHILSSGNTISSSTKPENLLAMLSTWRQQGLYPISGNNCIKSNNTKSH